MVLSLRFKKCLFYLLVPIVLGTLLLTVSKKQLHNKQLQHEMLNTQTTKIAPKTLELFRTQVDQLTTQTWKELAQHTGITIARCKNYQRQLAHSYKSSIAQSNQRKIRKNGTVSLKTKRLIYHILRDFNLDPSSISIIAFAGSGSPAGADDFTLYIDERDLATFDAPAQQFVIAHEIAHIKNHDHSLESALENLVNNKNKIHRRAKHNIARSSELRADVDAMLKGPKYAQGAISFFSTLIDRYGNGWSGSHPRNSERLAIANDIAQIQQCGTPLFA